MSLLTRMSTRPWFCATNSMRARFWASWLWSAWTATPAPPYLVNADAVASTLPGAEPSPGFPEAGRPVQYTMAPASASICETPLPMPRLAPVTTVTMPVSFRVSAVPQMRCVETQGDMVMLPGPETPGTHCEPKRCAAEPPPETMAAAPLRSGFRRNSAQVSLASWAPCASPTSRKSCRASLAALSPASCSPFDARACAATSKTWARAPPSPASPHNATARSHAFSAASASFWRRYASASVCTAPASPTLSCAER
mmetsp:Transcript_3956/g.11302  ORF Transcript_3956/g.11302 Transcript_3956/m.11302 type:complete len:255 (-) Transcript_3956:574-1338(-)